MRLAKRACAAVLSILATVSVAACGGTRSGAADKGSTPPIPPFEVRIQQAAALAADEPFVTIRHNPAADTCACPPFEIRVGPLWHRVRLLPGGLSTEELAAFFDRAQAEAKPSAQPRYFYVEGNLDDDPIPVCPNGTLGFELSVQVIHEDPPPPPTELPDDEPADL